MGVSKFESKTISLGTFLFDSKALEVPPFQRSYSWEDDNVSDLWKDVIRIYNNGGSKAAEHFFGAVVLVETDLDQYLILDGQQRIATSTILLCAIRDLLKQYNHPQWSVIEDKWIGKRIYERGNEKLSCKLKLNKYDRDFFRLEVQDPSLEKPAATQEAHKLIRKAKSDLLQNLTAELKELSQEDASIALLDILEILTRHLTLIKVSSKTMNDAASVFEILNYRGIGLSSADLVKNYLMLNADEEEQESMIKMWEDLLQLGGKVDEFLLHFCKSRYGDFSLSLYEKITDHLERNSIGSLKFCTELVKSSAKYLDILNEEHTNPTIAAYFRAVNLMGSKYLYPLVLCAYEEFVEEPQLESFLRNMLTLNTRYKIIGQGDNTPIETFFFKMAVNIRQKKGSEKCLNECIELMKSGSDLSYSCVDDRVFNEEFARARIKSSKWARYILEEIERFNRSGEFEIGGSSKVHVEHIYPQNPVTEERWPDGKLYVDRIGNLALIHGTWNKKMQNKPFTHKKDNYYKSSEFLYITKPLAKLSEWTSDSVEKRQQELAKYALKIWKFD